MLRATLMLFMGMVGVLCESVTATPTTITPSGFVTSTTTTAAHPGMTILCHQNLSPKGHGNCVGRHCGPQNYWPSDIPTVCETVPISVATAARGSVDSDPLHLQDKMAAPGVPTPAPTATTICHDVPEESLSYGSCFGRHCGAKNNWPSDIPKTCTTVVFATQLTSAAAVSAKTAQWTAKGGFTHVIR